MTESNAEWHSIGVQAGCVSVSTVRPAHDALASAPNEQFPVSYDGALNGTTPYGANASTVKFTRLNY